MASKEIQLSKGQVALVDDEDFEWLSKYAWWAHWHRPSKQYKARTTIKGKNHFMHRMVLNAPKGRQVDHRNGNQLDNRRENLRLCTHGQNQANRRPYNKTGYKGVCVTRCGTFTAYLMSNKKHNYLGAFSTPEDAARAYDAAAKKLHGDFAYLNFK